MTWLTALILGVVEGLTEYLPVSSTGHLILAGHVLGLQDGNPAVSAFEIVIQLGAILAVVAHYRVLLAGHLRGLLCRSAESWRLLVALLIAFLPAAGIGLALSKVIEAHLFGPRPVAFALVLGGVIMIGVERVRARSGAHGEDGLDRVTPLRALFIGLGQCVSLWPGSSRSMCTIVSAQLCGLSTATAAEFSFLLALPTLGAATLYKGYKSHAILASQVGSTAMAVGLLASFVVGWAVVAGFLRYLRTRGLEPFGWYRIGLGALVLWLLSS
ncbi:MAG: undecaprenyl-diphosphate phosphatase [Polyangiaceae bacterium]|jgi:undecaprenyl-diphosphatase